MHAATSIDAFLSQYQWLFGYVYSPMNAQDETAIEEEKSYGYNKENELRGLCVVLKSLYFQIIFY